MVNWFTRFTLRMLFGVRVETPKPAIDRHQTFKLSAVEAAAGGEKTVTIKNGLREKETGCERSCGRKNRQQHPTQGHG